jgi:hypothetical protein
VQLTLLSTARSDKVGILTFAFGSEYQTQAYCQALTADKNLNMEVSVVVEDGKPVDKKLETVARIIPLKGKWDKFEYEQLALDLTPYDLTYKTDADLLFPRGSVLYHAKHLPVTSGVPTDIRGIAHRGNAYREVETSLGLPSIYSACFSFNKHSESTQNFFDEVKRLYRDWFRLKIWDLTETPLPPTTDTVYSLAWAKVFGLSRIDGNEFIHAKPLINGWTDNEWTKNIVFMIDDQCRMYVDGLRLSTPFHYYDKTLIKNPNFVEDLENVCPVREKEACSDEGRSESKSGLRISRLQTARSSSGRSART